MLEISLTYIKLEWELFDLIIAILTFELLHFNNYGFVILVSDVSDGSRCELLHIWVVYLYINHLKFTLFLLLGLNALFPYPFHKYMNNVNTIQY